MRTRRFLCAAWLSLTAAILGACRSEAPTTVPAAAEAESGPMRNVILITLDTTRADRLGCYGYDKPTSPVLDALAKESVLFESAIAQASVTPVSHASILTGLNPFNHGLRVLHGHVGNRLDEQHVTLAETWKQAGGDTAAFVSAFPVTRAFGLEQGFDVFDADFLNSDGMGLRNERGEVNTGSSQRRADATTDAALKWLAARPAAGKPLLLWVHYFDPHDPIVLPPKEITKQFPPASKELGDVARAYYDADVFYMDMQIGRLIVGLKERGLWNDAVVVVVADHGEGLGDHDWWTHGLLYQEQIRVPMMIRAPGLPAGTRFASLVRTIDIVPTVLSLAHVPAKARPKELDGENLVASIHAGRTPEPFQAYAESVNMLEYGRFDSLPIRGNTVVRRDHKNDKHYCLIDGGYKLIYHQLKPENSEFYDLNTDPKELSNLAAAKPPEMQKLMEWLDGMSVVSDIMPGMTASDDETVKRLEGLGYLGKGSATRPATATAPAATAPAR